MLFLCALILALSGALPTHVVGGLVIDAKSHAVVQGASISLPNGKRIGVTGRDGRFRVEIPAAPWPPSLTVAASGLAERAVDLPHVPGDTNLKEIALSAAARIHATLPRAFAAENLRWSLYPLIGGRISTRLREGQLARGRADVILDGLASDNYVLLISGEGPLQQIAVKASPRPGETIDLPVNITRDVVALSVVSGKSPMAGVSIRMSPHDYSWSGIVACDEKGEATLELWQEDDFWASIVVDHGRSGFTRRAPLHSDTGVISWTFQIPSHHVKGRVVDSSTLQPMPDVMVMISGTAPAEGGLEGLSTRTDSAGRFDVAAVQEGSHTIRAYRKGYRYDLVQTVNFEKDDGDWEGEIALDPLGERPAVIVLDEAGHPLAGVDMFLAASEGGVVILEHTDESGHVTLPPRGGTVFAVPRAGSFGFIRVAADQSTDVTLRVPRAAGTIELLSPSTSGEPIANVYFLIRINGTWLPTEVFGRFAGLHALPFRTDETGRARLSLLPAGLYELWPVRSSDDVSSLLAGHPLQEPATVVVGDTPQIVTMTFHKKPQG